MSKATARAARPARRRYCRQCADLRGGQSPPSGYPAAPMRVLILGGRLPGLADGLEVLARGHEVAVLDNFSVAAGTVKTILFATPIRDLDERIDALARNSGNEIRSFLGAVETASSSTRSFVSCVRRLYSLRRATLCALFDDVARACS